MFLDCIYPFLRKDCIYLLSKEVILKISLAQTKSVKGDIQQNLEIHKYWITLAAKHHADLICFPELSLTGYEPALGASLATDQGDSRLAVLQILSNEHQIVIACGLPIKKTGLPSIGMVIISPNQEKQTYHKQTLHEDELPFFQPGSGLNTFLAKGVMVAPAICYESMQESHLKDAIQNEASVYLASVAKDEKGVEHAYDYFHKMASKYKVPILMSNCIGPCDDFIGHGGSGVWDSSGNLVGSLARGKEGLLIFDTITNQILAEI